MIKMPTKEIKMPEIKLPESLVKVPDFLLEMSRRMHTQDNRATADPLWQVRHKDYIATGKGINEHHFEIYYDQSRLYRSDKQEANEFFYDLFESSESNKDFLIEWCVENDANEGFLTDDDYVKYAAENFDLDSDSLPYEVDLVHVQEIEKIVSTHLTEADANWFIKRKQHDYPKLYTYVESAYWSPEIKELRDWIKSLAGEELCNT